MGFDLDVLARLAGPRLTFPTGRRFAPSQGQARPCCCAQVAAIGALHPPQGPNAALMLGLLNKMRTEERLI